MLKTLKPHFKAKGIFPGVRFGSGLHPTRPDAQQQLGQVDIHRAGFFAGAAQAGSARQVAELVLTEQARRDHRADRAGVGG